MTGVEKQTNSYTVWTSNGTGDGPKKNVEVYVGMDTPSYSLSNLKLEANGTDGLVLSWDALEGAHVDTSAMLHTTCLETVRRQ